MDGVMRIVHPGMEEIPESKERITTAKPHFALARRLPPQASFEGKKVALLDNAKVNARELFNALAERLKPLGISAVRSWRKRHAGETGAPHIAQIVDWKADLVLTGLGD